MKVDFQAITWNRNWNWKKCEREALAILFSRMTYLKFHPIPIIFAPITVSQVKRAEQIIAILTKFSQRQLGLKNLGNFQNTISPEPLESFHRMKKQILAHSIFFLRKCSDMATQAKKVVKIALTSILLMNSSISSRKSEIGDTKNWINK